MAGKVHPTKMEPHFVKAYLVRDLFVLMKHIAQEGLACPPFTVLGGMKVQFGGGGKKLQIGGRQYYWITNRCWSALDPRMLAYSRGF
mmetsp:Transcript_26825/g.50836  ORF Transcript_26825/g.50836 Transcript_26825/m.50836 type:complete len:87 (-) Transcript_26825:908-1168(-)